MARTVKDAALQKRENRLRLKVGRRYWRSIHEGLAIGYRRGKQGSGSWLVRFLLPSGKYDLKTIGTADDHADADGGSVLDFVRAQQKAIAYVQRVQRADGSVPTALTVGKAIERYVAALKASKGKTAANDADQRLKRHVSASLRGKLVTDLTLTGLKEWRNALVSRPKETVSKATANRILANLKAALNAVYEDERSGIQSDHAWRGLKAFKGAGKARTDHFEAEDVQKLVDEAAKFDQPFANLLAAGFLTGARYGDLAACDVGHFDARTGVLTIPKGKTGARPVTLMADAVEFFKTLVQQRPRTAPLLPTEAGERWGKSEQHRRIKRALKAAKLPATASFYAMRHSYISRAIENDVPLFIIARNCGTSEKMIREHYAHLIAAKERVMLERAAGAFKLTLIPGGKAQAA